jgi:hypothetical protein
MTAERDKFNVWVALMNLEDAYGGEAAQDAVMAVFNRSVLTLLPLLLVTSAVAACG